MGNLASQTFTASGTFTPPAGVTQVQVVTKYLSPFDSFSKSGSNLFTISMNGNAYGWGNNVNGQIGDSTVASKSSPVAVVGGLSFKKIQTVGSSASTQTTYGLTTTGRLFAWGKNTNGQLGDGTVVDKSSPVAVAGGLTFLDFAASHDNSVVYCLGLTSGGKVFSWGSNSQGALGDGTIVDKSSPVAVVGGLTFSKIFVNGDGTSFGMNASGSVFGWGKNNNGRLGDGTSASKSSPVQVVGGLSFVKMSFVAGNVTAATYGLTAAGVLYSWGGNAQGQLGDGTTVNKSSPVQVVGGLTIRDLSSNANNGTVVAIDASGTPWAWGRNNVGQVGDGTIVDKSSPVQVVGGLTFSKVYVSNQSSYGLTAAGALYGWGSNNNGQLGDNSATNKSSPVQVVGGLVFQEYVPVLTATASNGSNVAVGFTSSGALYAWGNAGDGDLGDGTIVNKSSPVLVLANFLTNILPKTVSTIIPVSPGTSYTVTVGPNPSFGDVSLGIGIPNSLIVNFEM